MDAYRKEKKAPRSQRKQDNGSRERSCTVIDRAASRRQGGGHKTWGILDFWDARGGKRLKPAHGAVRLVIAKTSAPTPVTHFVPNVDLKMHLWTTSVTMFVLCAMETMKQVHRCVDNDLSRALHGPWKSKTHPSTDLLVANKLTVQASGKVEAKARNAGGKVEAKARNAGDAPVPAKVKIAVVAPIQRRKTTPGQAYHQALLSTTLRSTHTRARGGDTAVTLPDGVLESKRIASLFFLLCSENRPGTKQRPDNARQVGPGGDGCRGAVGAKAWLKTWRECNASQGRRKILRTTPTTACSCGRCRLTQTLLQGPSHPTARSGSRTTSPNPRSSPRHRLSSRLEGFDKTDGSKLKGKSSTQRLASPNPQNRFEPKTVTTSPPSGQQPAPPPAFPLEQGVTTAPQTVTQVSVSVSVSEGTHALLPSQPFEAKRPPLAGPPSLEFTGAKLVPDPGVLLGPAPDVRGLVTPQGSSVSTVSPSTDTHVVNEISGRKGADLLTTSAETTTPTTTTSTTEPPTTLAPTTTTTEEPTTTTEKTKRPFGNRRRLQFGRRPSPIHSRHQKEEEPEEEEGASSPADAEPTTTTAASTSNGKKRFGGGSRFGGKSSRTRGSSTATASSTTAAPKRPVARPSSGALFGRTNRGSRPRTPFTRHRPGHKKVEEEEKPEENEESSPATTPENKEEASAASTETASKHEETAAAASESEATSEDSHATEAPAVTPESKPAHGRNRFGSRPRPPLFGGRPRPTLGR
ncbi:hypothetical protein MRX96_010056 [Rhipicephalus microplus]